LDGRTLPFEASLLSDDLQFLLLLLLFLLQLTGIRSAQPASSVRGFKAAYLPDVYCAHN